MELPQTGGEGGATLAHGVGLDRLLHRVGYAEEQHQFLAAGNGGVEEVALQHHVVLGVHDDNYGGVFAALRFVDGGGVGEHQFVQIAGAILYRTAVEQHRHGARGGVDPGDKAHIAVVHVFVVVVPKLHHPVAFAERKRPAHQPGRMGAVFAQRLLEAIVEVVGAERIAPHGGQDLHVGKRIEAELAGDALGHEFDYALDAGFGVVDAHKVEVALAMADFQGLPGVDVVGVAHDKPRLVLAENHIEPRAGDFARGDEVAQDIAGAHAGELIGIANHHHHRFVGDGRE